MIRLKPSLSRSFPSLTVSHYGDPHEPIGAIFSVLHDGDLPTLLTQQPDLLDACCVSPDALLLYDALEQDTGSELTALQSIAYILSQEPHAHLVMCKVHLPRSVCDVNRLPGFALRNIFKAESRMAVQQQLAPLHCEAQRLIWCAVQAAVSAGAMVLDVHTMWPFCPNQGPCDASHHLQETPDQLDRYVQAYVSNQGPGRAIDLITANEFCEIAFAPLTEYVSDELGQRRYPVVKNQPYRAGSHTLCQSIMAITHRALTIDIPKDYVTTVDRHNQAFVPGALELDPDKLNRLGEALGSAVLRTWQGGS